MDDEAAKKAKADRALERLKFKHAHAIELIKATCAFEHAALRPPILLNGGAVVAILALYGAVKRGGAGEAMSKTAFVSALLLWVLGLIAASLATAFGYYSQFAFRRAKDRQLEEEKAGEDGELAMQGEKRAMAIIESGRGLSYRTVAEVLIAASMILFVFGAAIAGMSLLDAN